MAQVARRNTSRTGIEFRTYLQRMADFSSWMLRRTATGEALARSGDQAAADRIVTATFDSSSRSKVLPRLWNTMSESIAEGNVGYSRVEGGYDPEKGVRFSTYAMSGSRRRTQSRDEYLVSASEWEPRGAKEALFRLRAMKAQLSARSRATYIRDHVVTIAERLGVRETDVFL